jgi:hypothetical protein
MHLPLRQWGLNNDVAIDFDVESEAVRTKAKVVNLIVKNKHIVIVEVVNDRQLRL